jgi:cytochrome bd ubiquinol oxidase subunit I
VLVAGLLLNRALLRGAIVHGPVEWGKISGRGMVGLFGLAAAFTWVMGLMGYIRSSGRLSWHVSEIMPDVSPWAFTPSLGFAAKMVTLNMVVFWLTVLVLFWISRRGEHPVPSRARSGAQPQRLLDGSSEEAQPT